MIWKVLVAVCLFAVVFGAWVQSDNWEAVRSQAKPEPSIPAATFNEANMISRARSAYASLVGDSRVAQIRVQKGRTRDRLAGIIPTWEVLLTDEQGRERVTSIVDARTGDLLVFAYTQLPGKRPTTEMTDRDAARAAKGWLATIEGEQGQTGWKCNKAWKAGHNHWLVRLTSAGRAADVALDRQTGAVVFISAWRTAAIKRFPA